MMKRYPSIAVLTGLLLWLGSTAAQAQERLKTESEAKAFTARVMGAVARDDLDQAYADLKRHTTLPAQEVDTGLKASIAQRNEVFAARYGKAVGYDFIGQKKLGSSMMRFLYIEQREKHPLVWTFNFYSTGSGWALDQFGWEDNTAALYRDQ